MEMNFSVIAVARPTLFSPSPGGGSEVRLWFASGHLASLRERNHAREAREDLIEQHADDADHQNGDDDVSDREVVPLVPDEVANAGAADQHLGGDDHQPGDA